MSGERIVDSSRPVVLFALLAFCTPPMLAQAWIAPKGETTVSLTFQKSDFFGHYLEHGEKLPLGGSHSRALFLEVGHSITDKLAVSFSVPYVFAKNGKDPSPILGNTGIDDGHYHSALQDYRFDVRYNVVEDPVMLTPFIRVTIPSNHYATNGEAAVGRDIRETTIGVNAGRLLDPRFPTTYVQTRVSYTFSERVVGIATDRENVDLSIGYFVTPSFSANVFGTYQRTHGGVGEEVFEPDADPTTFAEHDRLLRDKNVRIGFGASYSLSHSVGFSASWLTVVNGSESHYGDSLVLAVSYSTRPRL